MDFLLSHGYLLCEDAHEQAVMKPYPPLGLLYLSSYLKARGFGVQVFDSTFQTREAFQQLFERQRPSVVGLYANLMTRANVVKMARFCREHGCMVVVGGPEPAMYPEEYLAWGADVVVVGEGEQTLEELLPHLARHGPAGMTHIRGLIYREDGQIVRTEPRPLLPNLDALPFPDRGAVDMGGYESAWRTRHGHFSVSLIAARGCPYTCTWCSHAVFGNSHRRRSPENVADEVEQILATYHPEMLWYADDVFTIDHAWLTSYARQLQRRGLRVPFETISREDRLDEAVISTLAEMGCARLWVGAESGSQRVLDAMKRRTDARRVPGIVHFLQRHGIQAGLFVMLGYEGEELADLEATVGLLREAEPAQFLTALAYPIRGTPYYEQVRDRILSPGPWEEGSDRDQTVAGRHSRRYYRFVTRWMVNETILHHHGQGGVRGFARKVKAALNARVGRLGMWWTRREVEGQ